MPNYAQVPSGDDSLAKIKKLFEDGRWTELVEEVESNSSRGVEIDYYYGSALAQLGRWDHARTVLIEGRLLRPHDKRFPIELGGVAFKQKRYAEAARWLRLGLRLEPNDPYGTDFLATIYFLQGNLPAALKYWNRIAKPQVEQVRVEPALRVDPALLDRAFALAPASILHLQDFLTTQKRVRGLGIFPIFRLELEARDDGKFDAAFDAQERNGWGHSKWEALFATFQGVFYQTIYPEYFNLGRSATNISSLVRWDTQKRRLNVSMSAPRRQNPKYRYQAGLDLRNENWDLRKSSKAQSTSLGAWNLRREAINGKVVSFNDGPWSWSLGAEFSYRDYRTTVFAGPTLSPDILLKGYQLKQLAQLDYELKTVPERRFESKASISSETGAIWSSPAHSFEKLQGSVTAEWYPQMSGEDYAIEGKIRAGKTVGEVPFDELFMLGIERDNALWLRAHVGTHEGRKGSAPLGRNYFLFNWGIDKNVYNNGFFSVKLSPFVDAGTITDPSTDLGSRQWLLDTGLQLKFRVLGVGATFVYGKDMRSGINAFYATAGQ